MNYRIIDVLLETEKKQVESLLEKQNLSFETNVTETIAIVHDRKIIGTASLANNIIKMIAVSTDYQGENITGILLSELINRLHRKGIRKYFIYTMNDKISYFIPFGFKLVSSTKNISLLENNYSLITAKLQALRDTLPSNLGRTSAIVMNCNPITNGHLFLIETASQENDSVIIFLVEENKSVVPYEIRLRLIVSATKHLKNVYILPSTEYLISYATFPTYFLKKDDDKTSSFMELDATIFKEYFVPIFDISYRYVGTEELDYFTNKYNSVLQTILSNHLLILNRKKIDNDIISASKVRSLAKEKKYQEIIKYVPKTTYDFLISDEGRKLFE